MLHHWRSVRSLGYRSRAMVFMPKRVTLTTAQAEVHFLDGQLGRRWSRAAFPEPFQECPGAGKLCVEEVLITGDGLAQLRRCCPLGEAALDGGEDQLGGNGAMVDPGQVSAAAPDRLMEAPDVRSQEGEEVLPAIGHDVEPLSWPAPQREPALGMHHDVSAGKLRRLVRLDGDANPSTSGPLHRLAEFF